MPITPSISAINEARPEASRNERSHFDALAHKLREQGQVMGPFLPWHSSSDPYHWLVAETLLRRTTRTAAQKAFVALTDRFPTLEALAAAPEKEVADSIAWVGLGTQRSRQLKALARTILTSFDGIVPASAAELQKLPGVGAYIADAVLLYVFRQRAFPIDPNVQRLFRRTSGQPVTTKGTRHVDPYRDAVTVAFAEHLLRRYSVDDLQNIHRGLLGLAWTNCRPVPACDTCPLRSVCRHGEGYGGAMDVR